MPSDDEDADALLERVLEITLASPEGWRRVLPELTIERPDRRAADLIAAISRASVAIEDTFPDTDGEGPARRLQGLAALLLADAWAMAGRNWPVVRSRDLAARRRRREG